jgi:hypothetical protein
MTTDHAEIVRGFVTHASEVHSGGDAALAALDALVAERDEARAKRCEVCQDAIEATLDAIEATLAAEAEAARLRAVISAKDELLTAYRIGSHAKADRALAKLEALAPKEDA